MIKLVLLCLPLEKSNPFRVKRDEKAPSPGIYNPTPANGINRTASRGTNIFALLNLLLVP
jgi:hypothetical protein